MTTYRTVGNGPHKVLVLHGWLGDAGSWDGLARHLDGQSFGYVFTDARGYGASRGLPGRHTIEEMAADALAVADEVGWDDFSLVGHHMGAMAAQRILADAPERVRSLAAIAPVPANGCPLDEAAQARFVGAVHSSEQRHALIDDATGNRLSPYWIGSMVRRSQAVSDPAALGEYLHAWRRTDFSADIDGYELPVMAVVGEHDKTVTESLVQFTFGEWFPNCTVEVMPNAGHYPMFETPVQLATVIERFLAD